MIEIINKSYQKSKLIWESRILVILFLCLVTYKYSFFMFCGVGYEPSFIPSICYIFYILYILIPLNVILIIINIFSKRFVKISFYYVGFFLFFMSLIFPLVGKFWDQYKYYKGYDSELEQSIVEYKNSIDNYFILNQRDESKVTECTIYHFSQINNFKELHKVLNFDICGIKYFFDPNRSDQSITYDLLKKDRPKLRGFPHKTQGSYIYGIDIFRTKFKVYLFPKIINRSGMNLIYQQGIIESIFVDEKWVDFRSYALENLKEK